jgi:hypothetical protein
MAEQENVGKMLGGFVRPRQARWLTGPGQLGQRQIDPIGVAWTAMSTRRSWRQIGGDARGYEDWAGHLV